MDELIVGHCSVCGKPAKQTVEEACQDPPTCRPTCSCHKLDVAKSDPAEYIGIPDIVQDLPEIEFAVPRTRRGVMRDEDGDIILGCTGYVKADRPCLK